MFAGGRESRPRVNSPPFPASSRCGKIPGRRSNSGWLPAAETSLFPSRSASAGIRRCCRTLPQSSGLSWICSDGNRSMARLAISSLSRTLRPWGPPSCCWLWKVSPTRPQPPPRGNWISPVAPSSGSPCSCRFSCGRSPRVICSRAPHPSQTYPPCWTFSLIFLSCWCHAHRLFRTDHLQFEVSLQHKKKAFLWSNCDNENLKEIDPRSGDFRYRL